MGFSMGATDHFTNIAVCSCMCERVILSRICIPENVMYYDRVSLNHWLVCGKYLEGKDYRLSFLNTITFACLYTYVPICQVCRDIYSGDSPPGGGLSKLKNREEFEGGLEKRKRKGGKEEKRKE